MFRFLSPSRRQRPSRNPTAHRPLRLETLEQRYTLSGITAVAFDGPAELAEAAPPPHDQELRDSDSIQDPIVATGPPEIRDFDAWRCGPLDTVLVVKGTVYEDGSPVGAGRMVLIAWWDGQQPDTTAADGQFYFTTELDEPEGGFVSGVTFNEYGPSEAEQDYVEPP